MIAYSVIVAYEAIHTTQSKMKGSKGFMALKMDMSKANNRLEWSFLETVMRKIGFNSRWIALILRCVSTVSYSLLINGIPQSNFQPSRGIRQGDPLSPYLFILCSEALTQLINKAELARQITGIPIAMGKLYITHLFLADDCMLFYQAVEMEWRKMLEIVNQYEEVSGQRINKNKSSLFFSKNTNLSSKNFLTSMAGIRGTNSQDKYLGLPALVCRSRCKEFKAILDRVSTKMNHWKHKFLSQAWREIMLKVVIQAIPTYSMRVFKLPKSLLRQLYSLIKGYWWGLLKYFPKSDFLNAKVGSNSSYIWRSILSARELLKVGLHWRIRNAKSMRIWSDPWLPQPTTFIPQSGNKSLGEEAKVEALMISDGKEWNLPLINEIFCSREAELIKQLPISHSNQPDKLIWRNNANDCFTVKSPYHLQGDLQHKEKSQSSFINNKRDQQWTKLWKMNLPPAVKNFLWRACQNILPTKNNLYKRKVLDIPICPMCLSEPETVEHILWECASANDVLSQLFRTIQKTRIVANFGVELGMRRIILEGDSKKVVTEFNLKKHNGSYFGMIISDVQATMTKLEACRVSHVHREGNYIAHNIAKAALYVSDYVVNMEETPLFYHFL
ncbi:hypothetical protein F2P56_001779 [Juglans regia]|uniref:Reverse transcriptase domain-containing protein n=2 Tax=Juglans regia TaxID=51240 RepID=A0A833Y950_JUGRE|nr:uncharacterized protein LOC108985257 [Juglans regia]KAF5481094.1 hypothetical protein F2P56_001779 [Juglans regia]